MAKVSIVRKSYKEKLREHDFRLGWVYSIYLLAEVMEEYVKKNVEINHKLLQKELDNMIKEADKAKANEREI